MKNSSMWKSKIIYTTLFKTWWWGKEWNVETEVGYAYPRSIFRELSCSGRTLGTATPGQILSCDWTSKLNAKKNKNVLTVCKFYSRFYLSQMLDNVLIQKRIYLHSIHFIQASVSHKCISNAFVSLCEYCFLPVW